jgi:molybdopterin converting factor small subunit
MATLRLFANLRESAGTSSAEVSGRTVAEVLTHATEEYGDRFAAGLATAKVWVNGEPAVGDTPVHEHDEVALIPPVSGGATATSVSTDLAQGLPSLALVVALLTTAWASEQWYVFVVAGTLLAWLWDLSEVAKVRGGQFNIYPTLVAPVASATGAYAWGFEGFAGGLALGILVTLAWPVFDVDQRDVPTIGKTTTVAVYAGIAAGGLTLLVLISTEAVIAFIIVAMLGIVVAWIAQAYGARIQSLDPNVGGLLGALLGGLIVGLAMEDIDMAAALLGAVAVAAGLIGGRTFGSMLRTGSVIHTERAPGLLTPLDGFLLAAPLFWFTLWVFG